NDRNRAFRRLLCNVLASALRSLELGQYHRTDGKTDHPRSDDDEVTGMLQICVGLGQHLISEQRGDDAPRGHKGEPVPKRSPRCDARKAPGPGAEMGAEKPE